MVNFNSKYLKYKQKYLKLKNNQYGGDKIFDGIQQVMTVLFNNVNDEPPPCPFLYRESDFNNINYDSIIEKKIYKFQEYFFVKINKEIVYFFTVGSELNITGMHRKNISNFKFSDSNNYSEVGVHCDKLLEITENT